MLFLLFHYNLLTLIQQSVFTWYHIVYHPLTDTLHRMTVSDQEFKIQWVVNHWQSQCVCCHPSHTHHSSCSLVRPHPAKDNFAPSETTAGLGTPNPSTPSSSSSLGCSRPHIILVESRHWHLANPFFPSLHPFSFLGGSPNLAHLDKGPLASSKPHHIPSPEIVNQLEKPKTREELQALGAKLNE